MAFHLFSPSNTYWPASWFSARKKSMSVTYFKRYRMEIDLRRRQLPALGAPENYRLSAWNVTATDDAIADHAEAKYQSFRQEIDSGVFTCLSDLEGCQRLMEEIAAKEEFLPEATWLAEFDERPGLREICGTIQGLRANRHYGAIQNVGVTPFHRGRGVGRALVIAALTGFQQVGLPRAYLEVTAQNKHAVQLYTHLGFRRTKTLYKAVELVTA